MAIEELLFKKLGLYDGCEISCSIDGTDILNALFRIIPSSGICYIEQDKRGGADITEETKLPKFKYKYTWRCRYLPNSNEFTSGVSGIVSKRNIVNELIQLNPQLLIIPNVTLINEIKNTLIVTINKNTYIKENYDSFIKALVSVSKKHFKLS